MSAIPLRVVPTLDQISSDPGCLSDVKADTIEALLAQCHIAEGALIGRLLALRTVRQDSEPERLLTVEEAAAKLGMSRDYLYRHKQEYPFFRPLGRNIRFSSHGIDRYLRQRTVR